MRLTYLSLSLSLSLSLLLFSYLELFSFPSSHSSPPLPFIFSPPIFRPFSPTHCLFLPSSLHTFLFPLIFILHSSLSFPSYFSPFLFFLPVLLSHCSTSRFSFPFLYSFHPPLCQPSLLPFHFFCSIFLLPFHPPPLLCFPPPSNTLYTNFPFE